MRFLVLALSLLALPALAAPADVQTLASALSRERLVKVFQEAAALEAAAKLAAGTSRDALSCVQRAFDTYSRQFDMVGALNKSFAACSPSR